VFLFLVAVVAKDGSEFRILASVGVLVVPDNRFEFLLSETIARCMSRVAAPSSLIDSR